MGAPLRALARDLDAVSEHRDLRTRLDASAPGEVGLVAAAANRAIAMLDDVVGRTAGNAASLARAAGR
ncbi:MAG: hypothetical protein U0237_20630 [Thermoleophilia bacterium]